MARLEVIKTCSCEKDIEMQAITPGYRPKRKLLAGEQVIFIREETYLRRALFKVKSKDGKLYYLDANTVQQVSQEARS